MSQIRIIVEGSSDMKFIQDFISARFGKELDNSFFIIAQGNSLVQAARANSIQKNTINGGINILILDADENVENARSRISQEIDDYNLEIASQFFFPNNSQPDNNQPGNLETLLRSIINDQRAGIFTCIDGYGECLDGFRVPELRPFDEKAKMYVYVDSFIVGGEGKPTQRNYKEELLWNLNSENLQPLYEFLAPHFNNES